MTVQYSEGEWAILFACGCANSVLPKALAWAIPGALMSAALSTYCRLDGGTLMGAAWIDSSLAGALGGYSFALSFLLVFRTQNAYGRLWNGLSDIDSCKTFWMNAVTNSIAFCSAKKEKRFEVDKFQHTLVRLVSMMYMTATESCMDEHGIEFEVLSFEGLDRCQVAWLADKGEDKCDIILSWVYRLVVEAQTAGVITIPPPILGRVFQDFGSGMASVHSGQRLKKMPFPFPYAQLISILLQIHVLLTCLVSGLTFTNPAAAAVATFMTALVMWSLNYVAMELEMPFGEDNNDLPLKVMVEKMNDALALCLEPMFQCAPDFSYEPHTHEKPKPRGWAATRSSWDAMNDPVPDKIRGLKAKGPWKEVEAAEPAPASVAAPPQPPIQTVAMAPPPAEIAMNAAVKQAPSPTGGDMMMMRMPTDAAAKQAAAAANYAATTPLGKALRPPDSQKLRIEAGQNGQKPWKAKADKIRVQRGPPKNLPGNAAAPPNYSQFPPAGTYPAYMQGYDQGLLGNIQVDMVSGVGAAATSPRRF
eukprot:TRINITY_DN81416_c0_g1_i1.p1 TRINITY_DN81416_c0_g1~~TRINITY_DN81416_c0_g1_i1.p1  ORF type:complete len:571 (-),score=125.27 TRINITY_DN81416_c0_g1_i1:401-1996(-)